MTLIEFDEKSVHKSAVGYNGICTLMDGFERKLEYIYNNKFFIQLVCVNSCSLACNNSHGTSDNEDCDPLIRL